MNVIIRQEQTNDHQMVFELNSAAFGRDDEAKLVNLLRTSSAYLPELSIIALIDSIVVGHILFTKISINNTKQQFESLALAPMAVLPEFQGQGIGGTLIQTGLKQARELGFTSVIVVGHELYYPKFGFEPASRWNITAPFPVPDKVFMAIELVKNSLSTVHGTVRYAKEFELL